MGKLLNNTMAMPPLVPGMYTVQLVSFTEVDDTKEKKGYVKLDLQFGADAHNRLTNDNRFEGNFTLACNQINQQLNPDKAVPALDLLNQALKKPINVWVSYNTVNGSTYRNFNYAPPVIHTEVEAEEEGAF